jgi:FkbM family methyltransferase
MNVVNFIPKIFLKHKLINLFCNLRVQDRYTKCVFNKNSSAYIDLLDPEPRNTFIKKEFEPFFYKIALCFLPKTGLFFDLGANMGLCTFGLIQQRPEVKYHLFEANQQLVDLISKSIGLPENNKSKIFNNFGCLSTVSGFSHFNIDNDQLGQSHTSSNSEIGILTPNIILDKYCLSNHVSYVDFAKIDIEGQEFPALKGWQNFLSKKLVHSIFMECFPRNVTRYGIDIREPLIYLEDFGYTLYLCKKQDFCNFAEKPILQKFPHGILPVAKFKANNYPANFSTEILAVAS